MNGVSVQDFSEDEDFLNVLQDLAAQASEGKVINKSQISGQTEEILDVKPDKMEVLHKNYKKKVSKK